MKISKWLNILSIVLLILGLLNLLGAWARSTFLFAIIPGDMPFPVKALYAIGTAETLLAIGILWLPALYLPSVFVICPLIIIHDVIKIFTSGHMSPILQIIGSLKF